MEASITLIRLIFSRDIIQGSLGRCKTLRADVFIAVRLARKWCALHLLATSAALRRMSCAQAAIPSGLPLAASMISRFCSAVIGICRTSSILADGVLRGLAMTLLW